MLGAGSGGKSTIYKQLQRIYGNGITQKQIEECVGIIRFNCVSSILSLLRKSIELYEMDNMQYQQCFIDFQDQYEIEQAVKLILSFSEERFETIDHSNKEEIESRFQSLAKAIKLIWNLPQIQFTFQQRIIFSFITNMDYFFNKIEEIFEYHYSPNIEDVLKHRMRTTGLTNVEYIINGETFVFYDVGGQRNERKKWISMFDGYVDAILYVVALPEYAAVLFEDENKNAMHESLQLFEEIINAKWFKKTEIILLLNKDDLFREKLKTVPLSLCFNDEYYEEYQFEGDVYNGPNYNENDNVEHFEYVYQCSLQFIQNQFEKRNLNSTNKCIFTHVLNATNKDNIEKVFWDIQNIVIRSNLMRATLW